MLKWVAISRDRKNLQFEGSVRGNVIKDATKNAKEALVQKGKNAECREDEMFQVHIYGADDQKLDAFGISAKPKKVKKAAAVKKGGRKAAADRQKKKLA